MSCGPTQTFCKKREACVLCVKLTHQGLHQDPGFSHFVCPGLNTSEAPACLLPSSRVWSPFETEKPVRAKRCFSPHLGLEDGLLFTPPMLSESPESKMAPHYLMAKCSIFQCGMGRRIPGANTKTPGTLD